MISALGVVLFGAVLAGFVQGLSGFGFGLTAMSVWVWVLPPETAAALSVMGALLGQIIAALKTRRRFHWSVLRPFLLGAVVGIPIGVWVLPQLDVALFKLVLGAFLVICCPALLYLHNLPPVRWGGRIGDSVAGLAGGIMSGIGGFAGVPVTLWCSLKREDKDKQRLIIQNFNLSVLAVTFVLYAWHGLLPLALLPSMAIVAAAVFIPVLVGVKVYAGLSPAQFRVIVLGLLTVSGAAMLVSVLSASVAMQ